MNTFPGPPPSSSNGPATTDSNDTSAEMEHGTWVEPQPMATTSLCLPADVIGQLKRQAQARRIRYTTYVRSILECAANGT